MAPDASPRNNPYAPPSGEARQEPREAWTVASCIAASVRTSVRSPVLVWVGLGVLPNLASPLELIAPNDAMAGLSILLAMFVVGAVLAGGCFKLALELARKEPATLRVYLSYARFAPRFFVLMLPLLVPLALAYIIGEREAMTSLDELLVLLFIPLVIGGLYLTYRFSLAWYALADAESSAWLAVAHSWRRVGASPQFFALFVVTSIPLAGSFALATTIPMAGALFDVATSPLLTLCWAHAYDAGAEANAPQP